MKFFCAFLILAISFSVSAQEKVSDYLTKKGYSGENTFAVIIANEDYQSYSEGYTGNEELAIYQAERFRHMLIKQAGIPSENIMFYPDATNTHIKLALAKLQKNHNSSSNLIFYYRGKTFMSGPGDELFMVPVDSDGKETFFMFGLTDLYKRVSNIRSSSVNIFIDALPDKSSGTLCILDNGFVQLSAPTPSYPNLNTFTVEPPVTKEESGKPTDNIIYKVPEIKISSPGVSIVQTYETTVLIEGKIESGCPLLVVAVNGEEASFNGDGTFLARVALHEGENLIPVEAKNCAGWSSYEIKLTKLIHPLNEITENKENDSINIPESSIVKPIGKNYVLLIGVSNYKDAIMPDLFYPLKDALKIEEALISHYAFDPANVILLKNPGKAAIIGTLDSLSRIIDTDDSFLMFYAGHGSWDEKNRMGYWLPSDAAARVLDNWIMNSIITGFMSVIPAKHILVIADACFGGSIFRTRAFLPAEEKTITDLYLKPSRKAMTSGDMTEVPDESIFLKYFLQKLEENRENYISSEKLFFEVKPQVENIIDLIPQYGIIKNAGDEGGDYIFFRKQ